MILLPFLFGVLAGIRCMTPLTVLCWFAWLGGLRYMHTWGFWTANLVTVTVLTVFALGEYYALANIEILRRKNLLHVLIRLLLGALTVSLAQLGLREPLIGGVIFGTAGAALGIRIGSAARLGLASRLGGESRLSLILSTLVMLVSVGCGYLLHHAEMGNLGVEPLLYL